MLYLVIIVLALRTARTKISVSYMYEENIIYSIKTYLRPVMKTRGQTACIYITKTYLYNLTPLNPTFMVKLGFTVVYIIFSYFRSKT